MARKPWLAFALLLALNLGNALAPAYARAEPPSDLCALQLQDAARALALASDAEVAQLRTGAPKVDDVSFWGLLKTTRLRDRGLLREIVESGILEAVDVQLVTRHAALAMKTPVTGLPFLLVELNDTEALVRLPGGRYYRFPVEPYRDYATALRNSPIENLDPRKPEVSIRDQSVKWTASSKPVRAAGRVVGYRYRVEITERNPATARTDFIYGLVAFAKAHPRQAAKFGIEIAETPAPQGGTLVTIEFDSPNVLQARATSMRKRGDPDASLFVPEIVTDGAQTSPTDYLKLLSQGKFPVVTRGFYFLHDYYLHGSRILSLPKPIAREAIAAAQDVAKLAEPLAKIHGGKALTDYLVHFVGAYFDAATAGVKFDSGRYLHTIGMMRRMVADLLDSAADGRPAFGADREHDNELGIIVSLVRDKAAKERWNSANILEQLRGSLTPPEVRILHQAAARIREGALPDEVIRREIARYTDAQAQAFQLKFHASKTER